MAFLAQFPLQIVAFPGEKVNLHIFEPRYRQLFAECAAEGLLFGIPPYQKKAVQEIGTALQLVRIEKEYTDGKLDVLTRGIKRYRINRFERIATPKPYPGADIDWLPEDRAGSEALRLAMLELLAHWYELLEVATALPESPELVYSFDYGHQVGLTDGQKYQLLTLDVEEERLAFLINHLKNLIPVIEETQKAKARILANGHFKNFKSPPI